MPAIVDAHNDLLMELAHREARGEADVFARYWLEPLRRGGVVLQVCPLFTDLGRLPEGALREVMGQVMAFNRALRENPDAVRRVRTRADLEAPDGGRIGLMLSLEGAEPLGYDPRMAELMWDLGVRMLGLTWNRRNPFADGAGESGAGGLSRLGRELVAVCAELGMIVDLAHASERTFWDVLEAEPDVPVVCSHAACRALLDHPRNLSDEQLRALAARGGVLGLMLHPLAIDPADHSLDRALDHLEHAVEVMGAEHVGLGADFTRQVGRALGHEPLGDALLPAGMGMDDTLDGLAGPEDYPNLVAALRRRGREDDGVLSGNFLRFLAAALPAA
jgi:membrane dipeptidase